MDVMFLLRYNVFVLQVYFLFELLCISELIYREDSCLCCIEFKKYFRLSQIVLCCVVKGEKVRNLGKIFQGKKIVYLRVVREIL